VTSTTGPADAGPTAPRLRGALAGIPVYRPGAPAQPVDGVAAYKISSNENPYPPLPSVVQVITDAVARVNRYPDAFASGVVAAVADRLGVPAEHVVTGTGSVGVLAQVFLATVGPGDEVVYAWRSFEMYPILAQVTGSTAVEVPLTPDARHDLEAMAAAVTPRTRLVVVCSPNNPTGAAVRRDELERFLDRVPDDVLVVLDEAYAEFVSDPEVPDGVQVYRRRPNVAVLRTFSKAYGLAGLRVGYAVAHTPVADALRATAHPFAISDVAQQAAIASLAAEGELLERVAALVRERDRVTAALRAQGWDVPEPQGNFVWLSLGQRTPAFVAACERAGIVVRPFGGDSPDAGVRATIAEPEATERLLAVCAEFAPPGDRSGVR
jgi:histidinol-phosphate aminotransferase